MFHSLLVPVDGSPFAEHALPLAMTIARRAEVPLQVVQVHTSLAPGYAEGVPVFAGSLEREISDRERSYLEALAQRLTRDWTVRVSSVLLDDGQPVPDALHDHALKTGADLIVMSTHGRGPFSRFWLGSVTDELLRRTQVPLLLVRPQEAAPPFETEQVFRHVLIPLDGSALAEQVLEPAVALASLMQADCTLLQVLEPVLPEAFAFGGYAATGFDPALPEQVQVEAQAYLERMAERLRPWSLLVRTRVVIHQQTAAAILDEVQAQAIDLIALATHGRGGMERLFLGSVADKLVRGAPTPVLVQLPLSAGAREPSAR